MREPVKWQSKDSNSDLLSSRTKFCGLLSKWQTHLISLTSLQVPGGPKPYIMFLLSHSLSPPEYLHIINNEILNLDGSHRYSKLIKDNTQPDDIPQNEKKVFRLNLKCYRLRSIALWTLRTMFPKNHSKLSHTSPNPNKVKVYF